MQFPTCHLPASNGNVSAVLQQEGSLCAQHCLNNLLQGEYFTPVDLSSIAHQLDEEERMRMAEGGMASEEYRTFLQVRLFGCNVMIEWNTAPSNISWCHSSNLLGTWTIVGSFQYKWGHLCFILTEWFRTGQIPICRGLSLLAGHQQCFESVGFGDNPLQQPGVSELDD